MWKLRAPFMEIGILSQILATGTKFGPIVHENVLITVRNLTSLLGKKYLQPQQEPFSQKSSNLAANNGLCPFG